jgi:L-iditol 2-dehydrogenase
VTRGRRSPTGTPRDARHEPTEMRAFRKLGPENGNASVVGMDVPTPGPGEALVAVTACGICGSDLHAFCSDPGFEWISVPLVLGHEFSGTVVETGPQTGLLEPGDPVVAISIQGCGRCEICISESLQLCPQRRVIGLSYDGGLADYVVVPERYLLEVPTGLDLVSASLTEPLSVAVHAVTDKCRILPGHRVAVTGPGPIGLLCGLVAARAGADVVVIGTRRDAERRLPLAERFGLRASVAGEAGCEDALREHFGSRPPDAWIEASGSVDPLSEALDLVKPGGRVVVVGMYTQSLELPVTQAVRKEISFEFSYASPPKSYLIALELLRSGAVDAGSLQDLFPLEQAADAFGAALAGHAAKPTIKPSP